MLIANSHWRQGEASLEGSVFLAPDVRLHVVTARKLTFDSRFLCAARDDRRAAWLFCLLDGRAAFSEGATTRDAARGMFCFNEHELDGHAPDAPILRLDGEPRRSVDIVLPMAFVVSRARFQELPEDLGVSVDLMGNHALSHEVRLQAATKFCERLCEHGLVTPELAARAREPLGESVQRVYAALSSLYSTHETGAQLEVLAALAKISARQATRDMMNFLNTFPLPGKTFREVLKVLRLRRATLLLSCDETTVKSIAKDVGYGGVDAMARAFRDAGLPSPTEVRAALVPTA